MKALSDIKKIAVIGSGTMGSGITQLAAAAGYEAIMYDLNEDALKKGTDAIQSNLHKAIEKGKLSEKEKEAILDRITPTASIIDIWADVIIEAVVEKLDVKRDIFQKVATQNAPDCILASNTSSIPITQIAYSIPNPERVVGMHFFNPAHLMKLVEVISGATTAPEVAKTIYQLAERMGKTAVMAKDSPGFIVNRVARNYYVEALKILEEGLADVETIDKAMENIGFRMGPFKLMDLIGVDTNMDVTTSIYNQFFQEPRFRPSRVQKQKVDAGYWGRKSGKGFYDYGK